MKQPFKERREKLARLMLLRKKATKSNTTPDLFFIKCPQCEMNHSKSSLSESFNVCSNCGYHFKLTAAERLNMVFDNKNYKELDRKLSSTNPLKFPEYDEKLNENRQKTGMKEAAVTATGRIGGIKAVVAVLDSNFMMGSMGMIVGEKITRAIEYAAKYKLPLIIFSASGGARMQEGIFSLMQMAKTSSALAKFSDAHCLFISYITNPTTGGVTASFASLGDIILTEPGALIGFAGQRVIEQTIRQTLPEGFQRSEFMLSHGFVDAIVERRDMKKTVALLLKLHCREVK